MGGEDEKLIRLQRMADLGELTAVFVHELNQPMAGIKAFAELVRDNLDRPETARSHVQQIIDQSIRITHMLERMRGYSRGERLAFEEEAAELNPSITAALALMTPFAKKRHVTVHSELADQLPMVTVPAFEAQQIFVNLIRNAIEATTERRGTVRVATRLVGENVEAVVSDDGPGVPTEARDQIFEAFHTTKEDGTGLGLKVCRDLARAAGGELELRDSPTGATFALRVPVVAA